MRFIPTEIKEIIIIEPVIHSDPRGYFMEVYHKEIFAQRGLDVEFVQDNVSGSIRGTLRGLHYQLPPYAQGKLVRVFHGEVYDVAVDIRKASPTFGRWVGVRLSEHNKRSVYIPPGFAHGFYVLSERAQFTYKCTAHYAAASERGILWNDPEIGIEWPLISGQVIMSQRDQNNPPLRDAEVYV